MRDPFAGYDQWKTASPYDDEPDPLEEAQRWLDQNPEEQENDNPEEQIRWARSVIEALLEVI